MRWGRAAGVPAAPLGLGLESWGGWVRLGWDAVPGAAGYKVYRADRGLLGQAYPSTLMFEDADVVVGETYSYWVVAFNAAGDGPASAVVTGGP